MADTDILFSIIAKDEYQAQMAAARAAVDQLTEAEKQSIAVTTQQQSVEEKLAGALNLSSDAVQRTRDRVALLNEQYQSGQISLTEYNAGIDEIKGSLDQAGESSNKMRDSINSSLVGIKAGLDLAGQAVQAFKQVWDFAKEGAAVQRVGQQFQQVAADFNISGDALVEAMDKAAHGTVDDEELMQVATRSLTQGVITSQDQLVKFTEIARASAVRFGGDTSSALQSILYATEVGAQRQLKATLGVVDFTKAYDDLALKLGKRKQDLTDEEMLQARVNAVLDKGADLVRKVGAAGDDTLTSMQRLEVRLADLGDTVKANVATSVDGLLFGQEKLNNLFVAHEQEVRSTASTYRDYATEVARSGQITGDLVAVQNEIGMVNGRVKDGYILLNDQVYRVREGTQLYTEAQFNAARTSDEVDAAVRREAAGAAALQSQQRELAAAQTMATSGAYGLTGALDESERAMRRTKEAATALKDDLAAANTIMETVKIGMGSAAQNEMKQYNDRQESLQEQAAKLKEQIAELSGTQGDVAKTTVQHAMSAEQLALAQARLADSQARLSKETDPGKHAILAAEIAVQRDNIEQANTTVVKYVDNSKQIGNLKEQYDKVNEEIKANADQHELATKRIVFGYLEQELAAKGMTGKSAEALDQLALKWGLLSKADIDALNDARIAADTLAKGGSLAAFQATANAALSDAKSAAGGMSSTVKDAAAEASRLTGGLSDLSVGAGDKIKTSHEEMQPVLGNTTVLMRENTIAAAEWDNKVNDLTINRIAPLTLYMATLNSQLKDYNLILSQTPSVPPLAGLPTTAPAATSTTLPAYHAQAGVSDYIVPANPRGGMADYFPVMAAPGEHVSVTPSGGGTGGANINLTLNFGGMAANPAEIQAAVYDALNDVLKAAQA